MEGPKHQLRLVDLRKIVKPDPIVRKQYEEFEAKRAKTLASEESDSLRPMNQMGNVNKNEENSNEFDEGDDYGDPN